MAELSDIQKNQLRDLIAEAYNLDEMKDLCLYLSVEPENVGVETTRRGFARELVSYFERRGQLGELVKQISYERPVIIQNSGLLELINSHNPHEDYPYSDPHEEYSGTSTNGGDFSDVYLGVIVVVIVLLVAGCWYLYSNTQKQRELRDSEAFVTSYFSLLDKNNCQNAWERLSGDYRVNKHPTGYTPYCQYWISFSKVEPLKVEVITETDTAASVEVVLALTKPDNTVVNQAIVYTLTRPAGTDPWIIADSSP